MKKIIVLFMVCIYCISTNAADTSIVSKWTDISAWQTIRINSEQKAPLLWVSHEHKKFFLETRVNFDWLSTFGVIVGKTFQKKNEFWVTPKAGLLLSASKDAYNGTTWEVNFGGTKKKFSYFTRNQFATSFQKKNPAFVYQFVNLQFDVNKYFSISGAYQIYQETRKGVLPVLDIGPQAVFRFKGFYLKTRYTGDLISKLQKVTFGFGYNF